MPIYQVVVQQQYFNQKCINRWNYISSAVPSSVNGATGLASALGFTDIDASDLFPEGTLARDWQDLISEDADFVQIDIRNVYSTTDFYIVPFPPNVKGQKSASNGLSPATAYGCVSSRVNLGVNPGFKRFVGVTEDGVSSGGVLIATRLQQLQDLCDRMGEVVIFDPLGEAVGYTPSIVSKEKYTTPKGNTAYKYYATEAEQLQHVAQGVSWSPYSQTRTQVSRQYGRGN